jgi:hypothetical protein
MIPLKVGVRGNSGVKWSHDTFSTTSGGLTLLLEDYPAVYGTRIILSNGVSLLVRALDTGGCYCCCRESCQRKLA